MTSRSSHRRGFTLVELLVAITLLGLIAIALSGALRLGTRAWDTATVRISQAARTEIVQGLLRRELDQAVMVVRGGEGAEPPESFIGEAESLTFIAPLPVHLGVGGYHVFELALAESDDGRRNLLLYWRLYRSDNGLILNADGETEERVLLEDVDAVAFTYYGAENVLSDPDWTDHWEETARLPLAVSIDVSFPGGDARQWPPLTIAPRLATEPLAR